MTFLLELLGSSTISVLFGGILGYFTKREERANMAMKFKHDIDLIKSRTDASLAIAKMNVEESKILASLEVDKEEAVAFSNSVSSTSDIAETLKSCVRPIILALLMWQTWKIHSTVEELTGGLTNMDSTEVMNLYRILILTITGLTSTAVGWYFSQRSSKQFDKLVDKWY